MRVACMARRNILVEAARVLYLESAPPACFDAGRQASSVEFIACGPPACRRSI